ncbi:MAG TPA: CheR family methyltransferase, partial [Blastocatellia bacterium]|nr:CheR family methyltransferase [Blastocatellia bacterium]
MSERDLSANQNQANKPAPNEFLVVGVGASAGGIKALKEFFAKMPPDSGMAFVVILHLSQQHESNLASILQRETAMPVVQVTETIKVEPNKVYVIPPAKHLEMVDSLIRLQEPERVRGKRVPIDHFFRTLADTYGRKAVCIILSGTGTDGTLGMKHIKGNNGFAIVQDPMDAEYDGMPSSAIETKLADVVLPVSEMPDKLLFVRDSTEKFRLTNGKDGEVAKEIKNIELLRDVLTLLRVRTGHDFSNYKRPTLVRRVARHLQIHETDDLEEYLKILRGKPDEVLSLLKNLFINVTNFFRDKEAFATLEKKVIPMLFEGKTSAESVRVWIAGCASGEEAYSIAMLLAEYAATLPDPPKFQVFASDVDEDAIAEAREGRFTEAVVSDVSPERLRQFFVREEDGSYRIRKMIREMILFATHNILRDPPFSQLDLISCRNVMIYFNRATQEKVLQVFHFALREGGYLFLGSSESAENTANNFSAIDKKQRIFQCRPASPSWNAPLTLPMSSPWSPRRLPISTETKKNLQSFGELHHRLIEYYVPPSILVNEEGEILHLSESAGRFLRFVGGEPTANLLKVIHPALRSDLRAALFTARQENKTVEAKNIRVKFNGDEKRVNLTVRPVQMSEAAALVMFEETSDEMPTVESVQAIVAGDKAIEAVVRRLEDELRHTKDQLRNTIEQYETSTEELKASNEELQAINEELRSASEELETSKEELQSVNEEFTTVNLELKDKIDETIRANSDLQNLILSTEIATIFLDRRLRLKRYTPPVTEIFNIIPGDLGRPFAHITHRFEPSDFAEDAAASLNHLRTFEREVHSLDGRFFIARFSPY